MTDHLSALDAAYNRLIELWHESDSEQRAHEFIGITEGEYAAWAERSGMWLRPLAPPSESVAGSVSHLIGFHTDTLVIRDEFFDLAVCPPRGTLVAVCMACHTERGPAIAVRSGPFESWSFASTGPCACGASSVRFEARPPT